MAQWQLDGRVAVITGAGKNVGLGIARQLAESGAVVVVNDVDATLADAAVTSIRGAGGAAVSAVFDVTDAVRLVEELARVSTDIGPVDILVNNAGIPIGCNMLPFLDSTPDDWRPFIDLNVYGALGMVQAVLPGMMDRGWGRIVQISSLAASVAMAGLGASLYGASKAAIEAALRHIAAEVGSSGVTLNSLALGMMDNLDGVVGAGIAPVFDEMWEDVTVGRFGSGDDVGMACAWLCSEAGGFVTGQTIHLNGGAFSGR